VREGWSHRRLVGAVRAWLSLSIVQVLFAGAILLWGTRSITRMSTNFFIVTALVVALQVFVGNSGIVSFGHVAFFGIGAYVTAILTIPPQIKEDALLSLPPLLQQTQQGLLVTVLVGAVLAGVVAFTIGLAFARMEEGAMAMATLALLVMMHTVFANWKGVTRGTVGVYGIPRNVTLITALVGVVVIQGVALLFKASPTGLRLQATRDDPLAAQSLGIDVVHARLAGWIVSALLMGAGGSLWAQNILAFGPDQFFYAETFTLLSMLVIGGLGSVTGAVAGSAMVTVVSELLRNVEEGVAIGSVVRIPELPGAVQLTVALLIMVILILRPSGLLGQREIAPTFPLWSRGRGKHNPT